MSKRFDIAFSASFRSALGRVGISDGPQVRITSAADYADLRSPRALLPPSSPWPLAPDLASTQTRPLSQSIRRSKQSHCPSETCSSMLAKNIFAIAKSGGRYGTSGAKGQLHTHNTFVGSRATSLLRLLHLSRTRR
jgi:hypothetical protein